MVYFPFSVCPLLSALVARALNGQECVSGAALDPLARGRVLGCKMLQILCGAVTRAPGPLCVSGDFANTCPARVLSCPRRWEVALPVVLFPVLLLAYMKGNANLCRAVVRSGARLGVNNNQGVNIFNYQVATKQLLFRLLGEWPTFCSSSAGTVTVLIIWMYW